MTREIILTNMVDFVRTFAEEGSDPSCSMCYYIACTEPVHISDEDHDDDCLLQGARNLMTLLNKNEWEKRTTR